MTKDAYNGELGRWAGSDGEAYTADDWPTWPNGQPSTTPTWDMAYSETWGPMYDATTSMTDIAYTWPAEGWSEATNYLSSISKANLNTAIRGLSAIVDDNARQIAYTNVLNLIHEEAIFLPLTAKRNTAVVSERLTNFRFNPTEYGTGSVIARLSYAGGPQLEYTSCGVTHQIGATPSRVVTMNQGVTEFMLAMGLADRMVGTAYLDDAIWPQYATAYATVPVLASGYPTEAQIMATSPDFILGSYRSAFRERVGTR